MGVLISIFRHCYGYGDNNVLNIPKQAEKPEKTSGEPTEEVPNSYPSNEKHDQSLKRNQREGVVGLSHEKVLKGITYEKFEAVVEKLSERYELSDRLKNEILEVKRSETHRGEVRLQGDRYLAVVLKGESWLDLYLSTASIRHFSKDYWC